MVCLGKNDFLKAKSQAFRFVSVLLLSTLLLSLWYMRAVCASEPVKVIYMLNEIQFDNPPVLKNGRVLVPMGKFFEAAGMNSSWDEVTKTVNVNTESKKILFKVGEPKAIISSDIKGIKTSKEVLMDVPADIIGGSVMLPIRFIFENLGYKIQWEDAKKTIHINESTKVDYFNESTKSTRKILGNDYSTYYESSEARSLSKTLGLDIEERISTLCGISRQIVIFTPVMASISSKDQNDLLVRASYFDDIEDPYEKELFIVFTMEQGKYVEQFYQNTWRGKGDDIKYDLVDIDSDGKNEILLDVIRSSMAHYESNSIILKYINHKLTDIFNQSMSKCSNSTPYSYDNSLAFVQNSDKSRFDILFQINIEFSQDIYKFKQEFGNLVIPEENQKGGSKSFKLTFDGDKYTPDKPLPDYENYSLD